MTIAACYVSSEGVVFAADSTASYETRPGVNRHYNHAQKLFEIGEMGSTLGIVTWGRGNLPRHSYRQLVAELSDSLIYSEPANVEDACWRWVHLFWANYSHQLQAPIAACRALAGNPNRTPDENRRWKV